MVEKPWRLTFPPSSFILVKSKYLFNFLFGYSFACRVLRTWFVSVVKFSGSSILLGSTTRLFMIPCISVRWQFELLCRYRSLFIVCLYTVCHKLFFWVQQGHPQMNIMDVFQKMCSHSIHVSMCFSVLCSLVTNVSSTYLNYVLHLNFVVLPVAA